MNSNNLYTFNTLTTTNNTYTYRPTKPKVYKLENGKWHLQCPGWCAVSVVQFETWREAMDEAANHINCSQTLNYRYWNECGSWEYGLKYCPNCGWTYHDPKWCWGS